MKENAHKGSDPSIRPGKIRDGHNPAFIPPQDSEDDIPTPPRRDLSNAKPDHWMDAPPLGSE
jgi:hypothetical protein